MVCTVIKKETSKGTNYRGRFLEHVNPPNHPHPSGFQIVQKNVYQSGVKQADQLCHNTEHFELILKTNYPSRKSRRLVPSTRAFSRFNGDMKDQTQGAIWKHVNVRYIDLE